MYIDGHLPVRISGIPFFICFIIFIQIFQTIAVRTAICHIALFHQLNHNIRIRKDFINIIFTDLIPVRRLYLIIHTYRTHTDLKIIAHSGRNIETSLFCINGTHDLSICCQISDFYFVCKWITPFIIITSRQTLRSNMKRYFTITYLCFCRIRFQDLVIDHTFQTFITVSCIHKDRIRTIFHNIVIKSAVIITAVINIIENLSLLAAISIYNVSILIDVAVFSVNVGHPAVCPVIDTCKEIFLFCHIIHKEHIYAISSCTAFIITISGTSASFSKCSFSFSQLQITVTPALNPLNIIIIDSIFCIHVAGISFTDSGSIDSVYIFCTAAVVASMHIGRLRLY